MMNVEDESPTTSASAMRPTHVRRSMTITSTGSPNNSAPVSPALSSPSAMGTPSPVRAFYLHRNASSSTSTLGFRMAMHGSSTSLSGSRDSVFGFESPLRPMSRSSGSEFFASWGKRVGV